MDKKDLQYTPIGTVKPRQTRSRDIDQSNFRTTNIKSNGKKKGTAKWNAKAMVRLALIGATCAIAYGAVQNAGKTTTAEPVAIVSETQDLTPVETTPRYICDYVIPSGCKGLDDIIYGYTQDANEERYYKNLVLKYNGMESADVIKAGDVITLIGVPEDLVEKYNDGYNAEYDMNTETSIALNDAVQAYDAQYPGYAGGSLLDTVNDELNVYNSTTNLDCRKYLASLMGQQLNAIEKYGLDENEYDSTQTVEEDSVKSR